MVNTVQVGTKGATIPIGRQGENDATVVVFDISALIAEYGDGAVVLLVRRNKETDPYPVVVERDGETATWTVSNVDTARVGIGACELFYYVNDVLAKSIVYTTVVRESIDGSTGTQPDPYESWIEELTDLGAETLTNATNAAQSEANAKTSEDNAAASAEAAQQAENDAVAAKNEAVSARDAALEAQRLAEQAQASAEEAEDSAGADADRAAEAANSAFESKETAVLSANTATEKANAASASANTTSAKADAASESALTASTKASDAAASAVTAGEKATDASNSATSAENAKNAAERAQGKAEDAQAAAEAALEEFTTPTASATTLAYGSSATATYANGHFTFGIPQGKSPDATFSGTTLVIN